MRLLACLSVRTGICQADTGSYTPLGPEALRDGEGTKEEKHHRLETLPDRGQPNKQQARQRDLQAANNAVWQPGSQAARQPGSQAARQPGSQAARQPGISRSTWNDCMLVALAEAKGERTCQCSSAAYTGSLADHSVQTFAIQQAGEQAGRRAARQPGR